MDEFQGSTSAVVADVDCTTEGKDLCEKFGVRGYPSIKWGDASDMQDYNGERSFDALKKFADENLGPTCGPSNLDLCDEADKKLIAKFLKFDTDELDLQIEEKEEKIKNIETKFKKVTDEKEKNSKILQGKVEKENKKKDDSIAKEQSKAGYKFMKAVKAAKLKKVAEAEAAEVKESDAKKEEL